MKTLPKITSSFAILDVKEGREALAEHLTANGAVRIPVTITGFITETHGDDDGASIEFAVEVSSVNVGDPK